MIRAAVAIALISLGYALYYSGVSNVDTQGKGIGFFQSLGFKGAGNTNTIANVTPNLTGQPPTTATLPSNMVAR